ncbi:hypothetical protein JT359_13565 [Candidatus Poribacteria bacterium]|nr:hypothetical protein [Candidatus Poribacteria bacterium]
MSESNKRLVVNTEVVSGNTNIHITRSYPAMVLSVLFPGLGQLYLGQYFKAIIILIGFLSAVGFFYLNSYPVKEWKDLLQFNFYAENKKIIHTNTDVNFNNEGSIHLWTLDSGKIIMYRPSWKLKVTSLIQGLICWIYAVSSTRKGKPKFS